MKKLILLLIGIVLLSNIFAYSILENNTGNFTGIQNARIRALGSASMTGNTSIFASTVNPANFVFSNGLTLELNADLVRTNEDRSVPTFNFFDGYVGDATYVSNQNYYNDFSLGIAKVLQFGFGKIGIGGVRYKLIDLNHDYYEQVRNDENSDADNYPPIIAKNYFDQEGEINAKGFSIGFNYRNSAFGIHYAFLNGDADQDYKVLWEHETIKDILGSSYQDAVSDHSLDDIILTKEKEFDGHLMVLGMTQNIGDRHQLGISYTLKSELDYTYKTNISGKTSEDFILPSKLRIGYSFKPRNIFKTIFVVDLERVSWDEVYDLYDAQYNYYVGVEHNIKNRLPFRFGFKYENKYQLVDFSDQDGNNVTFADQYAIPGFTLGTGYEILKNLTLDVSFEYSYRKYDAIDLFQDGVYNVNGLYSNISPANRYWENPDHVEESFVKMFTTISYKW